MSCARHTWQEVGHIAGTISVECRECGSVAIVDRAGALLAGPFDQLTIGGVTAASARPVQLSFDLVTA